MRKIVFVLLASLALPLQAQVYKCRLANGQTEISSQPCQGSKTVEVRAEEKISEADRQAAERDLERARNYLDKREASQRADHEAELKQQRQQASQQRATSASHARNYSNANECLRDLAQMTLEASQYAQMESDCRRLRSSMQPQTVYVPYPVAVPAHRHTIIQVPSKPAPAPTPPAPSISIQPRK